jgi:putative intracellular protease/amidase
MSASINVLNAEKPKKIALIAANASVSKQTSWPIGFWWAELTHPYWEFVEKGYQVDIFSPEGGKLVADGYSDPEDVSGYSAHDIVSLGFKKSPKHLALVENTLPIDKIKVSDYDGIFLSGGQSPMYTFIENAKLHKLVADFYEAKKAVGIVCHATCVLLKTKTSDGKLLVDGKTWTGFADSEEKFADSFVGMKIQPFWIESEARKIPNTNYIQGGMFKAFAVRDGNLITGQQQFSGAAAAKLMIEALGI